MKLNNRQIVSAINLMLFSVGVGVWLRGQDFIEGFRFALISNMVVFAVIGILWWCGYNIEGEATEDTDQQEVEA